MNAPFRPAAAAGRDSFASFICDDTTLDVVRSIAVEFGWQTEKCQKGDLRAAVRALSVAASPDVLLVDLSESGDPLHDINALAEVCEPGTSVIAIGQVNDVRLYRDLVANGIHDYLLKPLSPIALREALQQAQAASAAPVASEAVDAARHLAVAVIGTRGGVGASTMATSLAWLFSTESRQSTALLDLDIHFGTGALCMDLEPGRGLTDAIENPGRIDGLFIERATIRANDNLAILSAEAPISRPLMSDGTAFAQLLNEFRNVFAVTVIDLPRSMMVNFPELLDGIGVIVLVAELTLASARDAIRLVAWFKTQSPDTQIVIVANKVVTGTPEISKADFEASIEGEIGMMVPLDAKGAVQAAKIGKPFVAANRESKAAAAIRDLSRQVLAAGDIAAVGDAAAPASKSLLDTLGIKGLLGRKGD